MISEIQIETVYVEVNLGKVENILKGSLDSISSPSMKIQIIVGKVCLSLEGKTLLDIANNFFAFKSLLTTSSNVLPLHLSCQKFEFYLKVKVIGSDPGYLIKSFLLYRYLVTKRILIFEIYVYLHTIYMSFSYIIFTLIMESLL